MEDVNMIVVIVIMDQYVPASLVLYWTLTGNLAEVYEALFDFLHFDKKKKLVKINIFMPNSFSNVSKTKLMGVYKCRVASMIKIGN